MTALMSVGVASASQISDASLHQLLALSGVKQQVQEIPNGLRASLKQAEEQAQERAGTAGAKAALSDEFRETGKAMIRAFNPDDMLGAIAKQIKRTMSEKDARAMLAWFNSPLGKRITQAEEAAATPAAARQILASAKTLLADKPRVQFAREQDKLLHLTDDLASFQENTAVASFVAFSGAEHPGRAVPIQGFRAKVAVAIEQDRPRLEQFTIIKSVYTYRHIDLPSLQKYLAFLKTKPALRFNKSVAVGLNTAAREATDKLAKGVVHDGQRGAHQ
ncbi:MAG: DUF2059 domain-containing protein [Gammaproteobacteria bacterium]